MPTRSPSSTRGPAWKVPAYALGAYALVATIIFILPPGLPVAPWWALAVPPVVYVALAIWQVRPLVVSRVLIASGALCAAHVVLLVATLVVGAVAAPYIKPPIRSVVLGALSLVCVPLLLTPWRSFVRSPTRPSRTSKSAATPAPPPSRGTGTAAPPPSPFPRPAGPPAGAPRPWPAPAPRPVPPGDGPAVERAAVKPFSVAASAAPAAAFSAPRPAPVPTAPPTAPRQAASQPSATPPAAPPAAPARAQTEPTADSAEAMIRIPFARVADQFVQDTFTCPAEQVGAQLREAGVLVVPERLVRPQLVEGLVRVNWPQVVEQFPRKLLALSDEQIVERLSGGALVLPLDEVVRQMPSGLFAQSAPASFDALGLGEFPLPFQPAPPPADSGEPAAAAPDSRTPQREEAPEHAPIPVAAEWTRAPLSDPAPDTPSASEPGGEQESEWIRDPVAAAETETADTETDAEDATPESEQSAETPEWTPQPASEAEPETEWAPEPVAATAFERDDSTPEPAPSAETATGWTLAREESSELSVPSVEAAFESPQQPASAAEDETDWAQEPAEPAETAADWRAEAPAATDPGRSSRHAGDPAPVDTSRAEEARRIAVLLGPLLSPVTVETCERDGASFLTLVPPGLAGDTIADVAARVLPYLTDARLPEPAVQATVRGTAMTVVITPLAGAPDMALAAATVPGASLAMLERLCLKEAAAPVADRRPSTLAPPTVHGGELREASPEPSVRAVAESLRSLGRIRASVLSDPDDAFVVYLFLPDGLEVRALGSFARDLYRALVGSSAGTPASVLFRVGTRRLVMHTVEGRRRAVLVAGGGPMERPGMVRLQLERAAVRLGRL